MNGGTATFLNETPSDVVLEHLGNLTVGGGPVVVGAALSTIEPGDNALIVSNGGAGRRLGDAAVRSESSRECSLTPFRSSS